VKEAEARVKIKRHVVKEAKVKSEKFRDME
jgi:hypothetical protein